MKQMVGYKATTGAQRILLRLGVLFLSLSVGLAGWTEWSFFHAGGLYTRTNDLETMVCWGLLTNVLGWAFSLFGNKWYRIYGSLLALALLYLWIYRYGAWT